MIAFLDWTRLMRAMTGTWRDCIRLFGFQRIIVRRSCSWIMYFIVILVCMMPRNWKSTMGNKEVTGGGSASVIQ